MAVISIDLDDQASAGLKNLDAELSNVSESTDDLQKSAASLTEEQQRQITIIQRSTSDWKTFAAQVSPALADVTVASLRYAEELAHIAHAGEEFAMKAGMKVITTLSDMAYTTLKYTLFTKGAVDVIHAFKGGTDAATESNVKHEASLIGTAAKATALGVVATTLTGQWQSVGQAAAAAGSVVGKHLISAVTLGAGASAGLAGFEAIMARTGERADELGNITTNLDRIKEAAGGLGRDLQAPLTILVENAKQFANNLNPIPAIWKEIDASATRSADQMIININNLRDYLNGTREQEEANARLEKQREREAPGFEAIRSANAKLEAQDKGRARQAEITSITTVQGVESEITKVREKAAAMAQAGQEAAEIERWLLSEITALRQRRAAIESDLDAKLRKQAEAYYEFMAQSERQATRERQDAWQKTTEESEKALDKIRQARQAEAEWETRLEKENEHAREMVRAGAEHDRQVRLAKEIQDQQRAALQSVQIEQEKQARLKAERQGALEKAGISGQQLLQQADPRQVLKNLQEQARARAQAATAQANQGLLKEAQWDSTGEARQKYDRLQRQAQQEAQKQATRDFARGNTDPAQLANAQAQVAGKQLQTMQANGRISQSTLQATTELLQATAQLQAQQQAQQREVDQLTRDAQAINRQNRSGQRRAQAQAGSL